ncbi:V-type proton ATPase subunit E1-like [Cynara cardunculus var. scolymus]|uniref:V-type proton ATPase subunit E1-like n=1 Tax=Cynara cardunculus var. scolymus TaxID=59895 RepID=UPI000D629E9C|nr:V-type proton ATPase subunit E1-like [Cynara cardunculus var. scolymus]
MNDADVSKQIQQMVAFIRQEAEEKANEISVSAEEEFNIHKMQMVDTDKKKIKQEYERKTKQVEVKKKIEYSMQLNASRIKVLQAQDDVVVAMKESARKELLNVSSNRRTYKDLVHSLILQGLLRLREPSVVLRCREIDVTLVEGVLEEAKKAYVAKTKLSSPKIDIDRKEYLPAPPNNNDPHRPSW